MNKTKTKTKTKNQHETFDPAFFDLNKINFLMKHLGGWQQNQISSAGNWTAFFEWGEAADFSQQTRT